MAASVQYSITSSAATLIGTGLKRVQIQAIGPYPVYIGGSNVTSANGFKVNPTADGVQIETIASLQLLETIYARCASGETCDVRVLETTL